MATPTITAHIKDKPMVTVVGNGDSTGVIKTARTVTVSFGNNGISVRSFDARASFSDICAEEKKRSDKGGCALLSSHVHSSTPARKGNVGQDWRTLTRMVFRSRRERRGSPSRFDPTRRCVPSAMFFVTRIARAPTEAPIRFYEQRRPRCAEVPLSASCRVKPRSERPIGAHPNSRLCSTPPARKGKSGQNWRA